MYDLFGDLIETGDLVDMPDPNESDLYNHSFEGIVIGFHDTYVTVEDQDGDCFDIEPERVTLAY